MNAVIFRYGILGALAILVLGSIHLFLLMPNNSWETNEVFGYLTMILSMVFVFFGVRHYRDRVNNGILTFGQGLKVGMLIVLIPAVFFGLFTILYIEVINPGWQDQYYGDMLVKLKANTPPEKLDEKVREFERMRQMFDKPIFQFLLMAGTVLVIGFIASIISAITLRRTLQPKTN